MCEWRRDFCEGLCVFLVLTTGDYEEGDVCVGYEVSVLVFYVCV